MEKFELDLFENFRKNIKDSLRYGPRGHVICTDTNTKEIITESDNLIVYRGRTWALIRAFNFIHDGLAREHWRDYYISLFAVGTGGSITGSPLNPRVVRPSDASLTSHGTIVDSDDPLNYYEKDSKKYKKIDYSSDVYFYKDVELETGNPEEYSLIPFYPGTSTDPDDSISEKGGGGPYPGDSFLVAKASIHLSQTEANGSGSQNINEAGLFASDLVLDSGPNPNILSYSPALFAKVTFPTIVKTADRDITFSWYIYF